MEPFSKFRSWYVGLTPGWQSVLQNVVIWAVAFLCLWWVTRGVGFGQFFKSLKDAKIGIFVASNVASFFLWWFGDTLLFAELFTIFHKKTGFRELLPATAAQYFLQAINLVAADGALVVFLNRRKGVGWLTATWTMMFQGLIDALVLATVALVAGLVFPSSPMHKVWPYAAGATGFLVMVAIWWAVGKPLTPPEKWMYNRPSAKAFREAGVRAYATLGSIRLAMLCIQSYLYYLAIYAFAPKVPAFQVIALTPGIQAASNEPITPQGLGPLQAVVVNGLSRYAPHDRILAAALGISIIALICRFPLGLGAAGTFAKRVLAIEASQKKDHHAKKGESAHLEGSASATSD